MANITPRRLLFCGVQGCEERTIGFETYQTYRFPLEVEECKAWVIFTKNRHASKLFNVYGPAGIRSWRLCSQHFEPSCFYVHGKQQQALKRGSLPTLCEGVEDVAEEEKMCAVEQLMVPRMVPNYESLTDPPLFFQVKRQRRKKLAAVKPSNDMKRTPTGHTVVRSSVLPNRNLDKTAVPLKHYDFENNDGFYNFLLEDDELPKEKKDTRAVCNCLCCRKNRMQKTYICCKRIQTEDCGDQPEALPVPIAQIDSCRLCFTTEQLEPLCSGMIVVRDEMLEKIYVCTGILIIPKPKQSMFICSPCGQLINSFHTYRQQVCSNNRAFIEHLERKAAAKAQQKMKSIHRQPAVPRKRKPPTASVTPRLKLAPETSMIVVPTEPSDCPIEIKEEPIDDPLEDASSSLLMIAANSTELSECSRSSTDLPPAIIKLPQERERSALSTCGPESNAVQVETTEDQDDLPEESWECWHCDKTFIFKFECAKHLLQNHQESVSSITTRMALDELNSNMLEMMSLHNRKSPPPVPKRVKFTQGNIARKQPNL